MLVSVGYTDDATCHTMTNRAGGPRGVVLQRRSVVWLMAKKAKDGRHGSQPRPYSQRKERIHTNLGAPVVEIAFPQLVTARQNLQRTLMEHVARLGRRLALRLEVRPPTLEHERRAGHFLLVRDIPRREVHGDRRAWRAWVEAVRGC